MADDPQREDDKDPAPIKHSDAERASNAQTPPDSAQKPTDSADKDSGSRAER